MAVTEYQSRLSCLVRCWMGRGAAFAGLLAVALLAAERPAQAACQPDPFASGDTVNCTAAGGTQTTTLGTGFEDDTTINVQTGATLNVPAGDAIDVQDRNVITNNGTIIVNTFNSAIFANNDNTIVNNGVILGGNSTFGIDVNNGNRITNNGSIIVGNTSAAIIACCDNVIVNNGSIVAGDNSLGIWAADSSTVTNNGSITVGPGGGYGILLDGDGFIGPGNNARVVNTGSIVAGDSSFGIGAAENYNVVNSGTITAGFNGSGIQVGAGNTITNTGTIRVGVGGRGIELNGLFSFSSDPNIVFNSGSIIAPNGFSIVGFDNNVITNTGYLEGSLLLAGLNNTLTNMGTIISGDPNGQPGTFVIVGGALINEAAGTLAVRVDPFINDTFQADTVTLNGGRLHIIVRPGLYAQTNVYSQFTTGAAPVQICGCGTLTGRFNIVSSSSPFFSATADYSSGIEIAVTLTRIGFGSVPGMTLNQQRVGSALEPFYSSTLDPASPTGQFFANLFASTSVKVLDQLSGEGITATQNASFAIGSQFNNIMHGQGLFGPASNSLSVVVPPSQYAQTRIAPGHEAFASLVDTPNAADQPGRWRIWVTGFGSSRTVQGEDALPGSHKQSINGAGGAIGLDYQASPDLVVGMAAGGSESSFAVRDLATSGRLTGGHAGLYAVKTWGAYYAAASLTYSHFSNSITRSIAGFGLPSTETQSGDFDSDQISGRVELGWRYAHRFGNLTPFVAVEPARLWQRGFTEADASGGGATGLLSLAVASHTATSLPTFLGVQFDTAVAVAGGTFSPFARVSWVHEFEPNRTLTASFVTIPGAAFTVDGARPTQDAARLDAGAKLAFRNGPTLFANFSGEWSGRMQSYGASGGLRAFW